MKRRAVAYLGGKCADCAGVFEPVQFDFHHKHPEDKVAGVATLLTQGWPRIREEVDKCLLLCANCRRLRGR